MEKGQGKANLQKFIEGKERILANIAMVVTVCLWGGSFVSIKIVVSEVPPITMALIRFIIASSVLWAILRKYEPSAQLRGKDVPRMLFAGILGVTLYFFFENTGVKLTTASNAALIVAVIPIIAISMDKILFNTRISLIQLFGIGMSISGTYLAATANGQFDLTSETFRGNLFIIFAMLSWSFYTLVNKSLHNNYSGLFLTTYQMLFGTLFLIPLSFLEYDNWHIISLITLGHILFLALFCSVVCYLFYMYALKKLDVTITTVYLNLVPITGVITGYLVLNEKVFTVQILGGLLTVLAVLIVNFEKYVKPDLYFKKGGGKLYFEDGYDYKQRAATGNNCKYSSSTGNQPGKNI